MNRGLGAMDQFDNGAAAKELRRAVAAAPAFYPARLDLGLALTNLREDPAEAEEALRAALALEPSEPAPWFLLGFLLSRALEVPRMEEAAAAFRNAARLAPRDPDARLDLGAALVDTGKVDEGIREIEEAVRLAPRLGPAIYQRAMAWRAAGRTEEAGAELRRYKELAQAGKVAEPVRDFTRWLPPAAPWPRARVDLRPVGDAFEGGSPSFEAGAALAVGDLDGDGVPDLVTGGEGSGWRRGLGGCRFGPLVPFPGGAKATGDLSLGDIDGDGRMDVAARGIGIVCAPGSDARIVPHPSRDAPGSLLLADLDADGWLDLAAGPAVWLNDGTGRFSPAPSPLPAPAPPPATRGDALALGDVDADGLEDAVVRTTAGGAALHRGALPGARGPADIPLAAETPESAVLADLDGDGDLDLVLAAGGRLLAYRNDGDAGPRTLVLSLAGIFSANGRKYGWSNPRGIGTRVTISVGRSFAVRTMGLEAAPTGKPPPDVLLFPLGTAGKADLVSLRWTEGLLQGEIDVPAGRRTVVERQRKTNW